MLAAFCEEKSTWPRLTFSLLRESPASILTDKKNGIMRELDDGGFVKSLGSKYGATN